MVKRLKKIEEELIHQNPWWSYKHDRYEKPDGQIGDYWYGSTEGVVMIVPVMEDGSILLTLQYRYLEDKQSIEFPAGGILQGMGLLESVQRELKEETGCLAREFTKIGSFQPSNGFIRDETHVFVAKVVSQGIQELDDTEEIELLYRRPDEIEDMIRRNDIWDGQSMASWSLVRHYFIDEQ
ncbi:MAG: NUDIX hydrolase [Candidatus Magasanikbacteria bacterium]|nr:NUDIX hydrolase [Candidatus Magasanikbacteria bacterium]